MAHVFGVVIYRDVFTEYVMQKQMFVQRDVFRDKAVDTVLSVGRMYQTDVQLIDFLFVKK